MRKRIRIALILVAIISFGIALSYPVKYKLEEQRTERGVERLAELRDAGLAKRGAREEEITEEEPAEEAGGESGRRAPRPPP